MEIMPVVEYTNTKVMRKWREIFPLTQEIYKKCGEEKILQIYWYLLVYRTSQSEEQTRPNPPFKYKFYWIHGLGEI